MAPVIMGASLILTSPTVSQELTKSLLTQSVLTDADGDVIDYAKFKDWFVECRTSKTTDLSRCELISNAIAPTDEDRERKEVSLKLIFEKANKPGLAIVQTPLDLLLSKGIDLEIDRRKLGKLSYRSCHLSGCLVPFSVSGGLKSAMLKGVKANFIIFDLDGKPYSTAFSLLGISNAIAHASSFQN